MKRDYDSLWSEFRSRFIRRFGFIPNERYYNMNDMEVFMKNGSV